MTLADGMVTFEMKEHFPSIEAARKPADRFLKSWEIQTGLQYYKSMIRLVYEDAKVIIEIHHRRKGSSRTFVRQQARRAPQAQPP
jgi:hypothetical protein